MQSEKFFVAVIGAGPAGLFASKVLAQSGARVVLFNRDIKPGGLAEYGIYFTKYRMKKGLRNQFHNILSSEGITYYGNVRVADDGDLSLDEIRQMGFQAILVTVGAQGTKWLGLPGEHLEGVYHAKDLVYHYNKLPPFSQQEFEIGNKVALIGVGNVMVDIAHWLVRELAVDEVVAVARRGPAEVKFDKREFVAVAKNLDLEAFEAEMERVTDRMKAVGQDPQEAKDFILSALPKAKEPISDTRFTFQFLSNPNQILGDENDRAVGLEIADTALVPRDGDTKAQRLGSTRVLDVDTVIFCIGDKVDDDFGLPIRWSSFVKNPEPRFPVKGVSYEAYDPEEQEPLEGVFVAGWSREASSGLVGYARKDGELGAKAVLQYLESLSSVEDTDRRLRSVAEKVDQLPVPVTDKDDVLRLKDIEKEEAEKRGLEDFKFSSNEEMLKQLENIAEERELQVAMEVESKV